MTYPGRQGIPNVMLQGQAATEVVLAVVRRTADIACHGTSPWDIQCASKAVARFGHCDAGGKVAD